MRARGSAGPRTPDIMIQAMTRFSFVTGGLLGGYAVTRLVNWQSELGVPQYYVIFLFIILGGSIGYVFGGIVGRELTLQWQHAEQTGSRNSTRRLAARHGRPRCRTARRTSCVPAVEAHAARVAVAL